MRIAQWVLPLINWNSYFAFPGVQPDGCPARPAVPAIDQKLKISCKAVKGSDVDRKAEKIT